MAEQKTGGHVGNDDVDGGSGCCPTVVTEESTGEQGSPAKLPSNPDARWYLKDGQQPIYQTLQQKNEILHVNFLTHWISEPTTSSNNNSKKPGFI